MRQSVSFSRKALLPRQTNRHRAASDVLHTLEFIVRQRERERETSEFGTVPSVLFRRNDFQLHSYSRAPLGFLSSQLAIL